MSERFKINTVEYGESLIGTLVTIFKDGERIDRGKIESIFEGEDGNTYLGLDTSRNYLLFDDLWFELSEETDKEKIQRLREELRKAERALSMKAPAQCQLSLNNSGSLEIEGRGIKISISGNYFSMVRGNTTMCLDTDMVLCLVDEFRKNQ